MGISVMLVLASILFSFAASDVAQDREECTQQLVGLATCLPYVGGNARAPTPDCCNGLKQVLKTNKKCLCVVIRDRNDPQLGLSINVTLALGLPTVCHASANVSQCPALLHMDPNSPDAQVFYQFGHQSNVTASSPVSSVKAKPATASANVTGTSAPEKNGAWHSATKWIGLKFIFGGVLVWYINPNLLIQLV